MNLAENFLLNRLYAEAIPYYLKVIDTYPDTDVAEEAGAKLEETRRLLQGERRKSAPEQTPPSTSQGEPTEPEEAPAE